MNPRSPVTTGLRCVKCGYELKGLAPDGMCPECASPIAASLTHPFAPFRTIQEVALLRSALAIVGSGLALLVPLFAANVLLGLVGSPGMLLEVLMVRVNMWSFGGALLVCAGGVAAWLSSPRHDRPGLFVASRLAGLAVLAAVLSLVVSEAFQGSSLVPGVFETVALLATACTLAAISELAGRIGAALGRNRVGYAARSGACLLLLLNGGLALFRDLQSVGEPGLVSDSAILLSAVFCTGLVAWAWWALRWVKAYQSR